jgi:putative two-component system response regulator
MALADVFDALTTPRVYKPPMNLEQARELIAAGRGSHFDPDVVDAFLDLFEEFRAIAQHHADSA